MLQKNNKYILAITLILGLVFILNSCSTTAIPLVTNKRDAKAVIPFNDIPAPLEMQLDDRHTKVINAKGIKSGTVVLTGYVKEQSLIQFYRTEMPKKGWTLQNMFTGNQTTLLYYKNNRSAMISIRENIFKTTVEIKSSLDK